MSDKSIKEFDTWYLASKYAQVVYPSHITRQPALDGYMAGREAERLECIQELAGITVNNATAQSAINLCIEALREQS